ncbi:MAG: hypothetical protein AB1505_36410 [Candidatus Latescibacterota bacterium]
MGARMVDLPWNARVALLALATLALALSPASAEWDNLDVGVSAMPAMGFAPMGGNIATRWVTYRIPALLPGPSLDTAVYKSWRRHILVSVVSYSAHTGALDLGRGRSRIHWLDTLYLRLGPRAMARLLGDNVYLGLHAGYGTLITDLWPLKNVHGFDGGLVLCLSPNPFGTLDGGHEARACYRVALASLVLSVPALLFLGLP